MQKNKRITISNDTLIFIWFLIKADIPQNQAVSREGAHYISLMAACVALMYGRGTYITLVLSIHTLSRAQRFLHRRSL